MSQAEAIVAAALIAVLGYLLNHALGRWAERKRAEERAVTVLATAAMSVLYISLFRSSFANGPAWRQFLPGASATMPTTLAVNLVERALSGLDEVVQAHGELLQHARKDLVDAATDVLNASVAISEQLTGEFSDAEHAAARLGLGQARLRLYDVSRRRRSWRWRLGRPAILKSVRSDS